MIYPNAVTQPTLINVLVLLTKKYPELTEYAVELLRDENRVTKIIYEANWRLRLYWAWNKK
jgi:hypothetical protein